MTLKEELEALRDILENYEMDIAAMLGHVNRALERLAEFEAGKEEVLGID